MTTVTLVITLSFKCSKDLHNCAKSLDFANGLFFKIENDYGWGELDLISYINGIKMAIVYQCKGPKDTWKQFSSLVRTNPVIGRFIGNIYILDERDAPKTAVQSIHPNACSRCFREEADDVCRLSRREIVDWRRKLKKTDPNKDICYFCDHNIAVHPLY